MINPESSSPEPQAQSGFAEALKIIEQKYGISTTDLGGQKEKIRKSISAEIEQLLTENFRIPAAVLMAKINEISRQLKPMELQLVNSMAMDIRAGRQVGNFDSLMMQMSMFDGGGSGRGGHDRKGRSFRAELVVLCVLLMLLLVACMPGVPVVGVGPVVVNEQGTPQSGLVVPAENTAIPPTKTATDIPATPTEMPTLTATEQAPSIPPELVQAFENGGYLTKTPESGDFYAIKIEGQSKFYSGIQYGPIKIFSTMTIARYVNGAWKIETILDGVCRTSGPNTNRFGFVDGDNVNKYESCPAPDLFRTKRENIDQLSQGNGNIMEAFYGYDFDPYREMLFEGVFPEGSTTVEIPGIGTVSTVTRLKYEDFVAKK